MQAGIAPLINPASVEMFALKEPSVFYAASGGSYRLATPQTYEGNLPNPLGGRPFPSKGYFLLREVKPEGDRAVIEGRLSIDPGEATAIIRESMTAMLQRMGRPPPSEQDLPPIQMEDLAHYLFDTRTGWPLSVSYERNIAIGPDRRVERLTIRVVAGE